MTDDKELQELEHTADARAREEIREWFDDGIAHRAAYLVVATDKFDWEDYPLYVFPDEDVSALVKQRQEAELSGVMEVYDLSADRDEQLAAKRTWAIESPEPILPKLFQEIYGDIPFLRTPRRP